MKPSLLSAIALGSALVLAPLAASATTDVAPYAGATGTVCGYLNAPSTQIAALQILPVPENIIVANSGAATATTTVATDGTFCFEHLPPQIYTITAFGDSPAEYQASVTVVAGKTRFIEVTRGAGL
ncbi:MAG: hypothetical protein WBD74_12565 [Candidatus Aquilonibacter sp.]